MKSFTLGSFNICSAHFREGHYTDQNLSMLADKIRESGVDVCALQEVDRGAARSSGVDMPERLSAMTDLHHHYFIKIRDFQGGEYGTAILSRFPIIAAETRNFDVKIAKQGTSCGYAVLDVDGTPVTVWNTHLSVESEDANTDTLTCLSSILRDFLADHPEGFLCCGDFNTVPSKVAAYIPFVRLSHDGLITYSDKASIDHILSAGKCRTSSPRIFDTQYDGTTDHHLLICDITVEE